MEVIQKALAFVASGARGGFAAVAVAVMSMLFVPAASAQVGAIDVSTATTYLEDNVAPAMLAIAGVVFTLAALAMGIRWVKATFFS